MIEIGGEVTNVAVFKGMLRGLSTIPTGSTDITDAIAGAFGIRRFQAERLKCLSGSAIASPTDHREMVPVNAPGEGVSEDPRRRAGGLGHHRAMTPDRNRQGLEGTERRGARAGRSDGGGAQLAGIAEFAQGALERPVRVGKPPDLRGMPDAMRNPGFPRWQACASMRRTIRSTQPRPARAYGNDPLYRDRPRQSHLARGVEYFRFAKALVQKRVQSPVDNR